MTEEERKDYLKYIENYTINDLADMFNTQSFIITNTNEFNKILLYYHFKQNEEIEQLQKENKELKEHIEKYEHYCKTTGIEELMKENQKYKEGIYKAIKLIEKTKERRYILLLEIEVLDILKEVE